MSGGELNSYYLAALDMPILHFIYAYAQYADYRDRAEKQSKAQASSGKITIDPYTGEHKEQ